MMKFEIEDIMIDIPDDPRVSEVFKYDLPHYLLQKDGMYHCGVCGKKFGKALSKLIANKKCVCPHCEVELEKRLITSRTNWRNLETEFRVEVFQVHNGRIAFRNYEVIHYVDFNLKERTEIKEFQRDTVYQRHFHQCIYSTYYVKKWVWGSLNENSRARRPKNTYYIYPDSLEEALKNTEVKYTGVGKYLDQQRNFYRYYEIKYIATAAQYPWIEYLLKMNATRLYEDILNYKADMRVIRPSLIKKYRAFIKNNNACANQVRVKRYCEIRNIEIKDETTKLLRFGDIKEVLDISENINFSFDKVASYIFAPNERRPLGPIYFYRDYITAMAKIGTPVITEQLAFPKDLIKAHDNAVNIYNAKKEEIQNNRYESIYQSISKLAYKNDVFRIVVPDDVNQIIQEGNDQHHCVGTYVDSVLEGKTVIVFIRKNDNPTQAFYTVEFKDKTIIQCRGKYNASMTDEVKAFTEEWLKFVKKGGKKSVRKDGSIARTEAVAC